MAIRGEVRDGQVYIGGRPVAKAPASPHPGGRAERQANRGRALEDDLQRTHNVYAAEGLARLEKVPTEWVVIRDDRDPTKRTAIKTAYPKRKAVVDYLGWLRGGRAVALEAKQYKGRLSMDLDPERGWRHEVEFLRQAAEMGAAAFLVARDTETGRTTLIPGPVVVAWADATLAKGRKTKAIRSDVLAGYPQVFGDQKTPVDWLPVALRMIETGEV